MPGLLEKQQNHKWGRGKVEIHNSLSATLNSHKLPTPKFFLRMARTLINKPCSELSVAILMWISTVPWINTGFDNQKLTKASLGRLLTNFIAFLAPRRMDEGLWTYNKRWGQRHEKTRSGRGLHTTVRTLGLLFWVRWASIIGFKQVRHNLV